MHTDTQRVSSILLVEHDSQQIRFVENILTEAAYNLEVATSGEDALDRIASTPFDLILLNAKLPEIDGFEICRHLKANENSRDIPVIGVVPSADIAGKVKWFELGAVDYLTRPFQKEELLERVRAHLALWRIQQRIQKKDLSCNELKKLLVQTLHTAAATNDPYIGRHGKQVGIYAAFLAETYGCPQEVVKQIAMYAPLLDIGTIGLPDSLLKKPGRYTPEEKEAMQQHVVIGARMSDAPEIDVIARNIVLYHHEKWDGTGYVHHLAGEAIPLEARIVAVADIYDALLSDRPYRKALPAPEAENVMRALSGKHIEPALVDIFFDLDYLTKAR